MPQLNPSPWFSTLLLAWLVILFLVKPKIMKTPNTTTPTRTKSNTTAPHWTWKWQ